MEYLSTTFTLFNRRNCNFFTKFAMDNFDFDITFAKALFQLVIEDLHSHPTT